MNKYLQKTLIIAIILGSLPLTSILGFSTNSFTSNNGFYSSNSIITTTTKPLSLVTNNITNSNGFQLTNNIQNNQITNNNILVSQSFVSNNNTYSNFQVQNNNLFNTFQPSVSSFQPTINNYQLTNNISSFQLSQPLTTNFQLTTNTFKPNIDNLLLNTNNLQANTFQLTQPSQDSFKLTTNNTFNLLNQANINSFQLQSNQLKTNDNTLEPLQNKPLDKVKEGYLILVPKNSDKPLYDNYIKERQDKYNIKIISLEERKTLNKPETVKGLLKDIYYNDFKPTRKTFMVSDLKWVVLDEKIAKGNVRVTRKDGDIREYESDFFYCDLDNDNIMDIAISRMSSRMVAPNLSKVKSETNNKILIALPFYYYIHTTYCPDLSCAIGPADLSILGNNIVTASRAAGIETVTLYETRSTIQPKYKPSGGSLNRTNFITQHQDFTIIIASSTSEPWNPYDHWKSTEYATLVTSIWQDKNKNGKVEDRSEIDTEEFYDFGDEITHRQIGFFELSINENRDVLARLQNNYYNFVVIKPGDFTYSPQTIEKAISMLSTGQALGSSCWSQYHNYLSAIDFPISWEIWGPPETTINDLIKTSGSRL